MDQISVLAKLTHMLPTLSHQLQCSQADLLDPRTRLDKERAARCLAEMVGRQVLLATSRDSEILLLIK